MVKGEAKLYLAVFIGWVMLPGSTVTRPVSGVQNSQIQELDDFEGELGSEMEDENNPVEEISDTLKLDFQPPATEKEITRRVKRDEKVAEWHMKILVKPGWTDWPDGVPVSAPSRSQRPLYRSSMVWTSLHPSQRILETDRWKDWAEEGITNLQAVIRYRERGSSVAKSVVTC
eukprot:3409378-Amphidinium_carterae.2